MEASVNLNYQGKRSLPGIDAGEAAQILASARQFLFLVSREFSGKDAYTDIRIRSYREGSDLFDLVVHSAAVMAPFAGQIGDFAELLKSCFDLLLHLQGKSPASVKQARDGGVFVENNSGQISVFNQPTFNLVMNTNASRAAEGFVRRPSEKGRSSLDIVSDGKNIISINKEDAEKFSEIPREDILLDQTYDTYLTIRTVVLEGDGIWRFADGTRVIPAKIEDVNFISRVRQGEERFGRGDILFVRLRAVQRKEKGILKTQYSVEQVLSHQANSDAGRQSKFNI